MDFIYITFTHSVLISNKTQYASIKINWLMHFTEIMAVYSDKRTIL